MSERPMLTNRDPGDESAADGTPCPHCGATPAGDDRLAEAMLDVVDAQAERDRLLALLWEMDDYADHLTGCATRRAIDPAACDCGLMEVKARAVAAWEEAGYAGPGLPWTYPPADTDRRT